MHLFNQFSYPLLIITLGAIVLLALIRIPQISQAASIFIMVGYVTGAILISTQLRYPDSPVIAETVNDVEATLTNGTPTFVMLYSNY